MKKLFTILLLGFIIFINFNENSAWCASSKSKNKNKKETQKLYNYNSRGQRQGYTQVTYINNKITRIETRDNGGRRLSVGRGR